MTAMDHEMMRFNSMTTRQLLTRLYRITKPEKLDAYIRTARKLGYDFLAEAAIQKRDGIRNETPVNAVFVSPVVVIEQNKRIEKNEKIIVQEIEHKRLLDF